MQQIKEYFSRQVPGSEQDWEQFASRLVPRNFQKGDFLIRPGETEDYLSFLQEGAVRLYVEKDEKQITFDFAFAGDFVSAYSSFLTRQPATFFIQALTPTVQTYAISYHDLHEVYQRTTHGQQLGRLAAEQLFMKKAARELSLLCQSPEERYLNLLHQHPTYVQHLPLKFLASYLGITPETLSRIRRRIS